MSCSLNVLAVRSAAWTVDTKSSLRLTLGGIVVQSLGMLSD